MASKYYTSTGKEVYDGDIVYADDLNSVNDAIDTALQSVEADIDAVGLNAPVILELAEAWAENPEDTQVEPGQYSALHWAAKAAADAVLTAADRVQTGLDRTQTGSDRVQTTADRVQTGADRVQTGLDAVATAADRVQTGLDVVSTAADRVAVEAIAAGMPTVPIGVVVAYFPGYFTNNSNGGFTNVLGNAAASANSLLNSDGWYVCNGGQINVSGSSIFNGSGRYLPNITDSRFLMGFTSAGSIGGDNSMTHTHNVDVAEFTSGATTLTIAQIPSHSHSINAASLNDGGTYIGTRATSNVYNFSTGQTGGGGSHTHTVNPPSTTSGAASATENRPVFLSCLYIMKVF